MEENKISKGKEILAILLLTMVIATGTFAWIVWSSKDNTKMNITIGDLADVSFKTGNDINISNLSPSFYYDDGALTEFSIRKKKGLTTELNTNIYLDITSISDELKNDNFKYVLLSSSDGNTYNEVISSSFKDASVGKLSIVTDTPLTDGKTYYKFYIWIDGNNENNETMQGKSLKGTLNVEVSTPPVNAINLIEGLDTGSTGDSGSGVYKVEHSAISSGSATGSTIPAVTDYRYYGPSPDNYICLDMEGQSTCPDKHLYRIIGSIYEEKENTNRIKVIKATPLTDGTTSTFKWDYNIIDYDESYNNIWATITSGNYSDSLTSGASLMKLLNSGLWWNGESGSYYNGSTTATTVNFTNYKLSDKAKSYISTSRYYLGGYSTAVGVMTNQFYNYERGTTRYDTSRPLYWDGKVGLMYPSDYGYAAGNTCVTNTDPNNYNGGCKDNDWLFNSKNEWLMSPSSGYSFNVFYITSSGSVASIGGVSGHNSARPTFYLTSTTSIKSGAGTSTDPYILS